MFAAGGGEGCWPIDFRIASRSGIPAVGFAPGFAGFLESLPLELAGAGVFDTALGFAGTPDTTFAGVAAGVVDAKGVVFTELFTLAGLLLAGAEPPQPIAIKTIPVKDRIMTFLNILVRLTGFKYGCAGLSVASPGGSDGVQTGTGRY